MAKIVDEAVEERVVQGPGDGIGGGSQYTAQEATQFKVAEVAGHEYDRTLIQENVNKLASIGDGEIPAPIRIVDETRRQGDFAGHQHQVSPHFICDLVVLRGGLTGQCVGQILSNDLRTKADNLLQQVGEGRRQSVAPGHRQGLDHAKDGSNQEVDRVVVGGFAELGPLLLPSLAPGRPFCGYLVGWGAGMI